MNKDERIKSYIQSLLCNPEWMKNVISRYGGGMNHTAQAIRDLENELDQRLSDPRDPEELAEEYMKNYGNDLLRVYNTLDCAKGVRRVTGWPLSRSKDYVSKMQKAMLGY